MRRLFTLALVAVLTLGLVALPAQAEDVEIHVYQLKVEINEAITNFVKRYSENTPGVNVTVETLGGGADYGGTLRAKLQASQMPDIFMIEGKGGYDLWEEYILDMSDADWVKDTDLNPIREQYWESIYGFETIKMVRDIFPMYELTLKGLDQAIKKLMVKNS